MAGRFGVLLGCALLASFLSLGGCARQTAPARTPVVLPRATARPKPAPVHTAPVRVATPPPSPTPQPVATPLRVPPDAPPQILGVNVNGTVRSGEIVSGTVRTSSNVGSVEVRIGSMGTWAVHAGVGLYALSYRVPKLPFFLKGHVFTLQIIARNARGDRAERDVGIAVR